MSQVPFRFPRTDEHTAILGCTGSGKTTLAGLVLSKAPFDRMPYIAIDYKGDDMLGSITRIREIGLEEKIPEQPGLYVIRPMPSEIDEMEDWLWKIWERGNVGLYIDEAYLLPNKAAIQNILAQGRSLRIPVIAASQRPVTVPRSIFTEASHIAVFRLNDERDRETVARFTPKGMLYSQKGEEKRLPDFHSFWYSVKDHKSGDPAPYHVLRPAPPPEKIVEAINARLAPKVVVT